MLDDARSVPAGTELRTDVCIIGAGAAGITLARRFIGRPVDVLLLEAGGLEIDDTIQELYAGESVGIPYFPLQAARLRYFGGSTNHWGGYCAPFPEKDFEQRPWVPHSGWPLTRAELDPYYDRARELVQLESSEWRADAWTQEGDGAFDLGPGTERRIAQVVRKSDRSFGEAYRQDLEAARNVRVLLHANVTEIEVPADGQAVSALQVATPEGTPFRVVPGTVVVATGGIENARLLLASRSTRTAGLGNERDLVGRFFMEHPRFEAAIVVPAARHLRGTYYETHNVRGTDVQGYAALTEEVQEEDELVDVQLLVEPVFAPGYDQVRDSEDVSSLRAVARRQAAGGELARHVRNVAGDLLTWRRSTIPGSPVPLPYPDVAGELAGGGEVGERMLPGVLGDIGTFVYRQVRRQAPVEHLSIRTRLEQAPNPDSRVTLGDERDALGVPRVTLDWRLTRLDRHATARTVERFGRAFAAAGVGRLRVQFDEDGTDWPDDLTGGWHHMGTTRMHDDPAQGVVDRHGQVHGIPNLYVAGSSVFPTSGSSTPTLTIVALALRLADRLEGLLR